MHVQPHRGGGVHVPPELTQLNPLMVVDGQSGGRGRCPQVPKCTAEKVLPDQFGLLTNGVGTGVDPAVNAENLVGRKDPL